MKEKVCTKCNKLKPITDFYFKNKNKGTRRYICKKCVKAYNKTHYTNNKEVYKDTAVKNKKKHANRNKRKLWDFLKDKSCVDCGESNPIVLEFDHINSDKKHNVGSMLHTGYSWKVMLEEINKCEVVCCNCHKIRTTTRGNHWRLYFE